MEVNKVGILISIFISLIIGIVLLGTTADQVYQGTNGIYTSENESITLSNSTAVSLSNDWVTTVTTVLADNGSANFTLVEDIDYTVASLDSDDVATITLNSTADADGNTSYVTYTYQDNNYIRNSSSRVLINLLTLFFALGLLGIGVVAMYSMGIMDAFKK